MRVGVECDIIKSERSDFVNVVDLLEGGKIAIIRTDTLYGIVAQADDEQAVERIFTVKTRDRDKPLIVLVARPEDAYDGAKVIAKYTDGEHPTTIIVDSPHAPLYLRHADGTVGYRVPTDENLRSLLIDTGPCVAPSANPQGLPPARNIAEARTYFGDKIDHYEDGGEVPIDQFPSRIIKVQNNGSIVKIR